MKRTLILCIILAIATESLAERLSDISNLQASPNGRMLAKRKAKKRSSNRGNQGKGSQGKGKGRRGNNSNNGGGKKKRTRGSKGSTPEKCAIAYKKLSEVKFDMESFNAENQMKGFRNLASSFYKIVRKDCARVKKEAMDEYYKKTDPKGAQCGTHVQELRSKFILAAKQKKKKGATIDFDSLKTAVTDMKKSCSGEQGGSDEGTGEEGGEEEGGEDEGAGEGGEEEGGDEEGGDEGAGEEGGDEEGGDSEEEEEVEE